jgi:hypothetical protein
MTTVLQVITAITLVVTSVTGVIVAFRVNVVHKIFNQQHTDLKNYQAALIRALQDKGIDVPLDQSAPQPQADR